MIPKGKNSLAVNSMLSMINTLLTMAFSLVTFPYATRVLGVDNIGKLNYVTSLISYFSLFAALGFNTYAIREGGRHRNDTQKIGQLFSQIFTMNAITVCIAYAGLSLFLIFGYRIRQYTVLILIQSITMLNAWIGCNWLFTVFEDYVFITTRSILVHLCSLVLILVFVQDPTDYLIYSCCIVFPGFAVACMNFVYGKRHCKISLVKQMDVKKHLKPIFVFFTNTMAISIYLNSDMTMLGFILGDYYVGLYAVAVNIYGAIKNIISAIYNTAIVRMSELWVEQNHEGFGVLARRIIDLIVLFSVPITFGLILSAEDIIHIISGIDYIGAAGALKVLAGAFLFAILGGFFAYCIAVPMKREKAVLKATSISAIENILLNLFAIPMWGIKGAAITTLLAEITVLIVLLIELRDQLPIFCHLERIRDVICCIIAAGIFIPIKMWLNSFRLAPFYCLALFVIVAMISYLVIGIFLRNKSLMILKSMIKKKHKESFV